MPNAIAENQKHHGSNHADAKIQRIIEHVAHLLPSQGPITAFVHHNTLHAFEELEFDEAVKKGAETFGCHPYLPEARYRDKVARGRICDEDIQNVLFEDLGERADMLLGFLGTRIRLQKAILAFPLHDGPDDDLQWVIADSNALQSFREDTPAENRQRSLDQTRQWIMRDFRPGGNSVPEPGKTDRISDGLKSTINETLAQFNPEQIESWSEKEWETCCLTLLWSICMYGVGQSQTTDKGNPTETATVHLRPHSELLFELTGEDSNELVNEVLIRFCSAFLDQGFSEWALPNRDAGFYRCFIDLYSQTNGTQAWRRGLKSELQKLKNGNVSPIESIQNSLAELGIDETDYESYLQYSLLKLRGFAGMLWQLETHGDRVLEPAPKGTLTEYLAIRLILERHALRYLARKSQNFNGELAALRGFCQSKLPPSPGLNSLIRRKSFCLFEVAQSLGWTPKTLTRLTPAEWSMVMRELDEFPEIERRRIYHLAFERKYRNETLDAVSVHVQRIRQLAAANSQPSGGSLRPDFHVVCCIDEREESFRRFLEEIAPNCETLGAAGFYAVPIYYRGAADAHYTPLCPVIIQPKHYVREEVVYSLQDKESQRKRTRRTIGTVTHRVHVGSRTLSGGWIGTTLLGTLATFPLVARILFPRLTAQFRSIFGDFVRPPEITKLRLERTAPDPGPEGGQIGFSVPEMAASVRRLLEDMGLTKNVGRLVIITGHGSASMNNPHEAAYDCGACSGGRGGPNARAFSQMANDPRVRDIVSTNGLSIPADTVFVGCYHNTCDDSVTFYDLDRIPESHQSEFESARDAINEARKHSAHERCRRFESAPLNLTADGALKHVEGRAEDLSQVRPEYGHATNALCFVGRREWSRGLFLDRRAFLQSYEPDQDDENGLVLERILQAVIPVCAGINLEYYFSYVDPVGYGCGTKLPHNITSLIGVMNGAESDLRPGLPWQMVEIHEPVRLLFVIETTPKAMKRIIEANESIARLCNGNWVQLAVLDGQTSALQLYRNGLFEPYRIESAQLDVSPSSTEWYRGWREHLKFASIGNEFRELATASGDG